MGTHDRLGKNPQCWRQGTKKFIVRCAQNSMRQYLTDTFHRINGSFLQKESSLQYLIGLAIKQ
jgi:hypothetical protein